MKSSKKIIFNRTLIYYKIVKKQTRKTNCPTSQISQAFNNSMKRYYERGWTRSCNHVSLFGNLFENTFITRNLCCHPQPNLITLTRSFFHHNIEIFSIVLLPLKNSRSMQLKVIIFGSFPSFCHGVEKVKYN